jgi:hypothetical protein
MIGVLMHKAFFIGLRVSRLLPVAIMGKDPQFGNPLDRGYGVCGQRSVTVQKRAVKIHSHGLDGKTGHELSLRVGTPKYLFRCNESLFAIDDHDFR